MHWQKAMKNVDDTLNLSFFNSLSVFRAPRQMQAGDVGASNSDIVTDKAEGGDTQVQDRFVGL